MEESEVTQLVVFTLRLLRVDILMFSWLFFTLTLNHSENSILNTTNVHIVFMAL